MTAEEDEEEKKKKETSGNAYEKSVAMWQEKSSDYKPEMKEEKTPEGVPLGDVKPKELDPEKMDKKVEKDAKTVVEKVGVTDHQPKSKIQKDVEKSNRDVIGR